ncbi:MAG: hypothetical protein ACRDC4_09935, partial [Plesiomonas sp.]
ITPLKPGITSFSVVGDNLGTDTLTLEVREPIMNMGFDTTSMGLGQRITASVTVLRHVVNTIANNGTPVTWYANSKNIVFVDPNTGDFIGNNPTTTTTNGTSVVKIAAKEAGNYQVWCMVGTASSVKTTIEVGASGLTFDWGANPQSFVAGLTKDQKIEVEVNDRDGNPVPDGTTIEWFVGNKDFVTLDKYSTETLAGKTSVLLSAIASGDTEIVLSAYGSSFTKNISVKDLGVDTTFHPTNTMFTGQKLNSDLNTQVLNIDGTPVQGAVVSWSATPADVIEFTSVQATTDVQGDAATTVKPLKTGSGVIKTTVGGKVLSEIKFFVNTGAALKIDINPNPGVVGQETWITADLVGEDGFGIEGATLDIKSDPDTGIATQAETSGTGHWEDSFTPLVNDDVEFVIECQKFGLQVGKNLTFPERTFKYEVLGDDTNIMIGTGQPHHLSFFVKDESDNPVADTQMEYFSNGSQVSLNPRNGGMTNGQGQNIVEVTPLTKGSVEVIAKVKGKNNSFTTKSMEITEPTLHLTVTPNPAKADEPVVFDVELLDNEGEGIQGVNIEMSCIPEPTIAFGVKQTDHDGKASYTMAFDSNSDRDVYAFLSTSTSTQSNQVHLVVNL